MYFWLTDWLHRQTYYKLANRFRSFFAQSHSRSSSFPSWCRVVRYWIFNMDVLASSAERTYDRRASPMHSDAWLFGLLAPTPPPSSQSSVHPPFNWLASRQRRRAEKQLKRDPEKKIQSKALWLNDFPGISTTFGTWSINIFIRIRSLYLKRNPIHVGVGYQLQFSATTWPSAI